MRESTVWVGLDMHRDWVSVAVLRGEAEQCEDVRTLPHDMVKLRRLFERLRRGGGEIRACYEASGMGYSLCRELREMGIHCTVAAPSLIPQRPGDRCKTDERDAKKLARLLRSGDLVAVVVPDPAHERVRALTRCRESFSREVRRSRQYVVKFLAAQGLVFREAKHWTQAHWRWLRALELPEPAQAVLDSYVALLDFKLSRLAEIDRRLEELAPKVPFADAVARVRCLRGFDTVGAMSVAAEIGDARRFESPRRLAAFLGLAVSERSSGGPGNRNGGGITKTGNSRCRRLLVEAAWHYRRPPRVSRELRKRREGQPTDVIAHADRAQHRLHARFRRLSQRKDHDGKVVVAVARELAGFLWAVMRGESQLLLARPR